MTNALKNDQGEMLQRIQELFGKKDEKYVRNKHTGGRNNEKGAAYENFFATYQLAKLAKEVIEQGKEIIFSSQVETFVDDLMIDNCSDQFMSNYQLKNSKQMSWSKNPHPIKDDFAKQHQLNQDMFPDHQSDVCLVVSDKDCCDWLENNMPSEIHHFSRVEHFGFAESLSKVLLLETDFIEHIKYLCALDDPEPDKLECVASVLCAAWSHSEKSRISVMELLTKAQTPYPSYIRSLELDKEDILRPEVKDILDNIPGFSYKLSKGFLHWSFLNYGKGSFPCSYETEEFRRFQERVIKYNPVIFDDLENLLV